jgi:MFS family permease
MVTSAARKPGLPIVASAFAAMLLAAGLAALVAASPARSWVLLVLGAALAGVGHGAAYPAAQDDLTRIAPGGQRAEVSAAFYVCICLGVSLPVIGIGILADLTTLFTAVTTFAVVTGACALVVAAWHLRRRDGGTPPPPARRPEDIGQALRDLIRGGTR